MSMYESIGSWEPEYLLEDPRGAEKIAIPCEPGNGELKPGTVMYRTSSGMYKPATTSELSTSYNLVILAEPVNTDANLTIAEDAVAYRSGRFITGKIILAGGGTITAAYALVLRLMNIVTQPMQEDSNTFAGNRYKITYKANNSASPAEPDYVAYADNGSTHTILANSVTGFTPPATKSFSKWNTKDDGSGTDYAAAASYTASADLTLYAIYA